MAATISLCSRITRSMRPDEAGSDGLAAVHLRLEMQDQPPDAGQARDLGNGLVQGIVRRMEGAMVAPRAATAISSAISPRRAA